MRLVTIALAITATFGISACEGVAVSTSTAVEPVDPTFAPPSNISQVTPEALPQVVSTGPALDLEWTARFAANTAYVNTAARQISVYSGPDAADRVGFLPPGNGGALDACAVEVNMCSITYGDPVSRGWVFMDTMAPAPAS